jgi:hypothetical protein
VPGNSSSVRFTMASQRTGLRSRSYPFSSAEPSMRRRSPKLVKTSRLLKNRFEGCGAMQFSY